MAAAHTLQELLCKEYEMEIVYPIKELRIFGLPSGEQFYNFLLANNWTRLTNWIVKHPFILPPLFRQREEKTAQLIKTHIEQKQADLVISLIPFINYPATEAARLCGIPLLLITTDNDLHNWVYALQKRRLAPFKVTIGSDLPTSKNVLLNSFVPKEAIETIGLPLRPKFLKLKSREELRQEYKISPDRKVVLIVMGGIGAKSSYLYAKSLLESSLEVHLVVCVGKSGRLASKLKKIKPANGNSIDIIPFTEKVHELFGLSDLIITKPGPGTINEALALKLPILVDQTGSPLFWEKINIDLILSRKVGTSIPSFKDVAALVGRYLYDEKTCQEVVDAYQNLPQNQFAVRIKPLIEEMCGDAVHEAHTQVN